MPSRTVSLERSAYERLRLAKRPGESFSEVVVRLLGNATPSFSRLAGALSRADAESVREGVREMRALELGAEQARLTSARRRPRGRHA